MGTLNAQLINEMMAEQFPGSRSRCTELGPDYAIAAMDPDASDIRPGGFVSGPTQFAIIDSAFWFATFAALGRIEPMAMTSELSIRFLRPAQGHTLYCHATVEATGRRNVVATGHVWMDDRRDKVTSTAQGTYALPAAR